MRSRAMSQAGRVGRRSSGDALRFHTCLLFVLLCASSLWQVSSVDVTDHWPRYDPKPVLKQMMDDEMKKVPVADIEDPDNQPCCRVCPNVFYHLKPMPWVQKRRAKIPVSSFLQEVARMHAHQVKEEICCNVCKSEYANDLAYPGILTQDGGPYPRPDPLLGEAFVEEQGRAYAGAAPPSTPEEEEISEMDANYAIKKYIQKEKRTEAQIYKMNRDIVASSPQNQMNQYLAPCCKFCPVDCPPVPVEPEIKDVRKTTKTAKTTKTSQAAAKKEGDVYRIPTLSRPLPVSDPTMGHAVHLKDQRLCCIRTHAVPYLVREGDILRDIAKDYCVDEATLIRVNKLPNRDAIYPKLRLTIPKPVCQKAKPHLVTPRTAPVPIPVNTAPAVREALCCRRKKEVTHHVVNRETLNEIAAKYCTTLQKIQDRNKKELKDPNAIYPGQLLIMPLPTECTLKKKPSFLEEEEEEEEMEDDWSFVEMEMEAEESLDTSRSRVGFFKKLVKKVKKVAKKVVHHVKKAVKKVVHHVKKAVKKVVHHVKKAFKKVKHHVKKIFKRAKKAVKKVASKTKNVFKNIVNRVRRHIPFYKQPNPDLYKTPRVLPVKIPQPDHPYFEDKTNPPTDYDPPGSQPIRLDRCDPEFRRGCCQVCYNTWPHAHPRAEIKERLVNIQEQKKKKERQDLVDEIRNQKAALELQRKHGIVLDGDS